MKYRTKAIEVDVMFHKNAEYNVTLHTTDLDKSFFCTKDFLDKFFDPVPETQEQPDEDPQLDMFEKKDAGLVFPTDVEHNQ